jgi:hypothetical protein
MAMMVAVHCRIITAHMMYSAPAGATQAMLRWNKNNTVYRKSHAEVGEHKKIR